MRSLLVLVVLIVLTIILGTAVLLAALVGVKDRPGGIFDWAPRLWSRAILVAAGVRVRLHGVERIRTGQPCIFASNHVSWFDVFTLAATLRRYKFVGKAELFRLPIFGPAARAAGMIPIERENRKSAFESYDDAARKIREGASVVVYPEGTRGVTYALRPFNKAPFVLAAAARVPIVPTIIHGTIRVHPKGTWWERAGQVDVHFLEEISTEGTTYADRDWLAQLCWERMAEALEQLYGVHSDPPPARATRPREDTMSEPTDRSEFDRRSAIGDR
jgi:1-acyl-sn-glycerol-3-phosphate acyltransferase